MWENEMQLTDSHAFFEQIEVPPGRSFLWRVDDYPWARNVWNYHPEFEVHLIRHSSGVAYVGDFIGQFEAGDLYLVGSDLPHDWITPQIGNQLLKGRDIVLQFDPSIYRSQENQFAELSIIKDLFDRAARGLLFHGETRDHGRRILESMDGSGSLRDFSRMLELLDLLATSQEYTLLSSQAFIDADHVTGIEEHILIEKALDYLRTNFLEAPALVDVANLLGMSETSFSRFFKKKTGNNYSEHLASLRLWMAGKLLIESDLPITDICFESGFHNIANFNRTFLKRKGMTPSQYRKAARQRNLARHQERALNGN